MYKYRFQQWGLRKYLNANEYEQIRYKSAVGGNVRLPVVRGRELGSKRLKHSVTTENRLRQVLVPSRSPLPGRIDPPDALRNLENILHAMAVYSNGKFEKGEWGFTNYDPEESFTCSWWHGMDLMARRMLEKHDLEANFYLLDKCCEGYRTLLRVQDPLLLWGTFFGLMELSAVGNDIAMSFAKFVVELCRIELGRYHPMTTLLAILMKIGIGSPRTYHTVVTVCDAQFDVFCNNTSPGDQFWPLYARLMVRSLAGADITMSHDTVARLESVIQWNNYNPGPDMRRYERLFTSTRSFLAIIYIRAGRHGDAAYVLREIEDCNDRSKNPSHYLAVNIAELRGNNDEWAGRSTSAEDHFKRALTLLSEMNPTKKRQTRLAVAYRVLESFYQRSGNEEAVLRVRREHNDQLKAAMNRPTAARVGTTECDGFGCGDSRRLVCLASMGIPQGHDIQDIQCYPGYQIDQTVPK
ncbi:hypothetical protein BKA67DRAFT_151190 [Truncatella angustata]|uniref:Uncharacterized protein n=1 Tax=Truncatella angustata TaxID=152316 RepID=A0A9P8ZZL0_9PEZI|nr:uncharacterized protein BKA67DRAFT_151190 [Truncatella angustata]KAH6656298.1 hypothetical protein BKA67DRAFT_151190 [Truncatella angustata]